MFVLHTLTQAHLRSWMEVVNSTSQLPARKGEEVQICLHIMNMFHLLPASTFRLFEPLLVLTLKGEKALGIEVCESQLGGHTRGGSTGSLGSFITLSSLLWVHTGPRIVY